MADSPYLAFLHDPDQASRRAELEQFFAPNPAPFLKVYDRLHADMAAGGRPKFRLFGGGFCWPAFFTGPVWFLYRKMWLIAGIIIAVMVALPFLPGTERAGVPLAVALALSGHRIYVQHAITLIQKARTPDGGVDDAMIARAAGVSRIAAWIGGMIYGLLVVVALVSLYLLFSSGEPLPR
jgi:hypothetical protein